MSFNYRNLPYDYDALEPFLSAKTMTFHHDKHYKKYIATLNQLTADLPSHNMTLEVVMMKNHNINTDIFQSAAQAWNHEFYWKCLSPKKPQPSEQLLESIAEHFGSLAKFKDDFEKAAVGLFGSGWVWVVRSITGVLEIKALEKAENPMTSGQTPIFVCDVWEHAYYLDYQNDRARYLSQQWDLVNWAFFEENILASKLNSRSNQASLEGLHELRAGI
jgi:Fe-Mn family superoxide dismutase